MVNAAASECLAEDVILELVQGLLADDALRGIEHHLVMCADCRTVVADTAGSLSPPTESSSDVDTSYPSLTTQRGGRTGWSPRVRILPLTAGTRVGRYETRELIGAGGIGFVYAAHDPELHRKVALKVLRPTSMPLGPGGDQRARLLREARAMAQLSHPNVVTVYDAGTYEDRVFLAMELVDGTTLRRWLEREARSIGEILSAFRAAGDGLSAAHRIGLVHRDFKPENVLVGNDGRVRVTDFGLARSANGDGTGAHRALGSTGPWMTTTLTRTGIMAGTPAYMAPEQFAGEPADPRSDQFGFCVALYEALYGNRPFEGETVEEIANATLAGRMRPPPSRTPVPTRVRDAIVRGLAVRPDRRFPTMDALLVELAAPAGARVQRRSRVAALAVAAAILLGGAAIAAVGLARAGHSRANPIDAGSPDRTIAAPPPPATAAPAGPATKRVDHKAPVPAPAAAPAQTSAATTADTTMSRRPKRADRARRPGRTRPSPQPAAAPSPTRVRLGDRLRDPFHPLTPGGAGAP